MGASDIDLLRRFEPVLRMAHGERFFPAAVDDYVRGCSLHLRGPSGNTVLAELGSVTVDDLARLEGGRQGTYLQFVDDTELSAARGMRWRLQLDGPGRLSRVGFVGRIADALFRLSLRVRGTVPSGVAAAASAKANRLGVHEKAVYYGRVLRDGGWTVLHYQFFYAMNDWRSAFGGVNDHEADWEQILLFVEETGDDVIPRWVAYATHDHSGDDLRRAWEDPELEHIGEHPVVYPGAGSHASYFKRGEYVTRVDVPALRPLQRYQTWFRRLGRLEDHEGGLGIPFVDVAPGDGVVIGPGGDRLWEPILLSPDLSWVADFRGLWGLDTADFTGGERAPAGPRFERDGSIRTVWSDPLGYAGMHKVVPPGREDDTREQRLAALEHERQVAAKTFDDERAKLRAEVMVGALGPDEIAASELALATMRRQEAALLSEHRKLSTGTTRACDPRSHLTHPAEPEPLRAAGRRRMISIWAALSAPLILGLAAAAIISPEITAIGFAAGILLLLVVEAFVRGHLFRWLLAAILVALIVAVIIVAFRNWRWAIGGAIGVFALLVLWGNIRELTGRR